MKVSDLFLGLKEGGFDLLFRQGHQQIVDEGDITCKVGIHDFVTRLNRNLQKVVLSGLKDGGVDKRFVDEYGSVLLSQ